MKSVQLLHLWSPFNKQDEFIVNVLLDVVDKHTMVMLVGTAKIRLPLITSKKKQRDQLGQVYWETKRRQGRMSIHLYYVVLYTQNIVIKVNIIWEDN